MKFQNAINAGAVAAVIMNEGNTPDRSGFNNFNPATTGNFPVLTTTFAVGQELANGATSGDTGRDVRVNVDIVTEELTTRNVIAETSGRADNVVVVAPTSTASRTAPASTTTARARPRSSRSPRRCARSSRRTRCASMWYSAEESGLLGSEHYVDTLPVAERRKIAAMLNFDMLASPNFVRFVYDGDQNAFPPPPIAPPGSGGIEKIFTDYFASRGLASSPTEFSGRSDYGPFIAQGVPAGGLFTGAEGIKTAAEAATYGGAAGEQYDPCYHTYCDTLETLLTVPPAVSMLNSATNRNSMRFNGMKGFDQMADAAAHATITLAQSTAAVNGNNTGNPGPPPAALRRAAADNDESQSQ